MEILKTQNGRKHIKREWRQARIKVQTEKYSGDAFNNQ